MRKLIILLSLLVAVPVYAETISIPVENQLGMTQGQLNVCQEQVKALNYIIGHLLPKTRR